MFETLLRTVVRLTIYGRGSAGSFNGLGRLLLVAFHLEKAPQRIRLQLPAQASYRSVVKLRCNTDAAIEGLDQRRAVLVIHFVGSNLHQLEEG
jgi:hypothetical protein